MVAAALLAGPDCGNQRSPGSPAPTPSPSSAARDQYVAKMNQSLDALIQQTSRLPQSPLVFGANLILAHEAWIDAVPQDALELCVDAFRDAGVRRVDINMGLFPWLDEGTPRGDQNIAKYDAVVQRIRADGLQLVLNPQYSPTYHRLSGFDEWTQNALSLYEEIARRYQPDILVVVHEPTTMASRLGVSVTPQQWADFAQKAAQAVNRVSRRTRRGAGGIYGDVAHFGAFAALPDIDVLTLDIYDVDQLPTYTDMVRIGRRSGKPVYIEETWRTPFAVPRPGDTADTIATRGVGDQGFQPLDAKWLQALTQYAGALGLEAITPSWTQAFFKYVPEGGGDALDPAYTAQVVQALRNGERTQTYLAFSALSRR